MATHSSILAWRIPWTEEPGGLQSMGSQKSWTQLSTHTHTKALKTLQKIQFTICYRSLIGRYCSTTIFFLHFPKPGTICHDATNQQRQS